MILLLMKKQTSFKRLTEGCSLKPLCYRNLKDIKNQGRGVQNTKSPNRMKFQLRKFI